MENALRQIAGAIPETLEKTDRFKQLLLNEYEQKAFAEAAIDLRWDGEQFAVDPQDLLYTRRREEKEPTLWNTYNVIQEHLIKGGIEQRNVAAGSKNYGKTTRSRKVTGLDANLQLNRALWTLTEKMAELRAIPSSYELGSSDSETTARECRQQEPLGDRARRAQLARARLWLSY